MKSICEFLRNDDGPTSIEYGVMLALIIVACLLAITAAGNGALSVWQDVRTSIDAAAGS